MTTTWTLTCLSENRRSTRHGAAANPTAARQQALHALAELNAAAGFNHPHYTLTVAGQLAAIIHTGLDTDGLPDHRGVAELLGRIGLADTDEAFTPEA